MGVGGWCKVIQIKDHILLQRSWYFLWATWSYTCFVYEGKCSYKDVSDNVLFGIIAVQGFSPFYADQSNEEIMDY